MRIVHIITTINRGGAENQLLLLAREQVRLGHDVSVLDLKGSSELANEFSSVGVNVISNITNRNILRQIRELRKISQDYDVNHAHLPRAELLCALTRPKVLIVSRHNAETFFPKFPGLISVKLSQYVQQKSKVVVAISETVKEFLIRNGEVPAGKLRVVRYGFDDSLKYSAKHDQRVLNGFPKLGTVSRLAPQKDLKTLIRAVKRVVKDFPEVKLSIVGTGELKEVLQNYAAELGVSSQIDWLGSTTSPLDLMRQMDIFIMTSLYEGFGLVTLESISQKTPVIAADNDTFKELFEEAPESLFRIGDDKSLAEKIIDVWQYQSQRELALHQKKILDKFNPLDMIQAMEKVYQEVTK